MKKNIIAAVLTTIIAAAAITACGGSSAAAATAAAMTAAETTTEAAAETTDEEAADTDAAAETPAEPIRLTIGVTGSVYDDLWAPAIETLEKEGIILETVQFSDYVTPNNALANGETDLNGFQHRIYLASEIEQYGYEITNIGNTFISPMNLYSDKLTSLDEIQDGDVIAIPNDPTNGGRAIKVLSDAGLITLKADAGFNPTVEDVENYNVGITIEELAANTIPSVLPDVAAAIINGNYALDFGLRTEDALFHDKMSEEEYWNLIACRTEDLSDPVLVDAYDKVVKAYQSAGTKQVYDEQFGGYYVGVGWDQDLLADYK
ncbi:MAG: MetQ/NlpA family ABC transporter substrate-binding protein [Lachnospiraceae bacterium]|nr:MetQ/NlpA family ABC transporter substrate-binding protein [Lachnospiraceae bacterium]